MKIRRGWLVQAMFVAAFLFSGLSGWAQMGRMANPAIKEFMESQTVKGKEFQEAENKEGREFMESLAGKSKAEKIAAVRTFKTTQYEKNCTFREKMIAERDEFLAKIWASGSAPPQQMQGMMKKRFADQNAKIKEFFAKKHEENMAFLDKVLADASLDGPGLDKAMGDFFKTQKATAEDFVKKMHEAVRSPGQGMGGQGGRKRGF